jgi:3beta-hydroxy-delta5-steroid dehydrogenase/steroid delta-isomerase
VNHIKSGLLCFAIGPASSKVDWVYVDNLVYAHILASERLADVKSKVNGNAYCISDQNPINQFEFLRPLIEGRLSVVAG